MKYKIEYKLRSFEMIEDNNGKPKRLLKGYVTNDGNSGTSFTREEIESILSQDDIYALEHGKHKNLLLEQKCDELDTIFNIIENIKKSNFKREGKTVITIPGLEGSIVVYQSNIRLLSVKRNVFVIKKFRREEDKYIFMGYLEKDLTLNKKYMESRGFTQKEMDRMFSTEKLKKMFDEYDREYEVTKKVRYETDHNKNMIVKFQKSKQFEFVLEWNGLRAFWGGTKPDKAKLNLIDKIRRVYNYDDYFKKD